MFDWVRRILGYEQQRVEVLSSDEQILKAAEDGNTHKLLALLESGASVNTSGNLSLSAPLHLAVRGNHEPFLEILLQQPNIDLEKFDKWGRTPLHLAVVWHRLKLLKRLLDRDPELVNVSDADGKTPLHYACASGSETFVKLLIEYKADLNSLDHRRWTPLTCAVAVQSVATVELLLKSGASCNQAKRFSYSTSALKLAIEKHNLGIVELLLNHGAHVEFTQTVSLGSFSERNGHRRTSLCHNLATLAIDCVDLTHRQSIDVAYRVVQASPSPPDEDSCVKLYEQYIKPSKKLKRSLSRDLIQLIEQIDDAMMSQLLSLLNLSLALGVDLSKSSIERLIRKFQLKPKQDVVLFDMFREHKEKSLRLHSSLTIRKQLVMAGHNNLIQAVNKAQLPNFIKQLVLLERW